MARSTASPVPALARAAAAAVGGLAVAAGAVTAAGSALQRQGRAAVAEVEMLALQAARLDGLVPEDVQVPLGDIPVPRADGAYHDEDSPVGSVPADELSGVLALLGDSTSVGYGCRGAEGLPGVWLARRAATARGGPVRLTTQGKVGSGAADLDRQVTELLGATTAERSVGVPVVAVVLTGANDITGQVPPWRSVRLLQQAIQRLHGEGVAVVMGSCPSFGVLQPIPSPLRHLLGVWSARLGKMQERATRAVGARAVSIGRLVSPAFRRDPTLFSPDHFHPGESGYALASAALLPEVLAAFDDPPGVAADGGSGPDGTDVAGRRSAVSRSRGRGPGPRAPWPPRGGPPRR